MLVYISVHMLLEGELESSVHLTADEAARYGGWTSTAIANAALTGKTVDVDSGDTLLFVDIATGSPYA